MVLKHVTADQGNVLSVIPGIALNSNDPHALIQIMDGLTGKTHYLPYQLDAFHWDPRSFKIQVGSSTFSLEGIHLDINSGPVTLSGKLDYSDPVRYPGSLLSPGDMSRRIKESNDSIVEVNLSGQGGDVIFNGTGHRAGLEIVEKIFDYL